MSAAPGVIAVNGHNVTEGMTNSVFSETFESFQKILPYETTSFVLHNTYHPWILSVIGAIVVGLSGIVPFIIIPLDRVDSLKNGSKTYLREYAVPSFSEDVCVFLLLGSSQTLRMLLSFAVGGLLGDVFLHLLPEVWNNARSFVSGGGAHSNSTGGLWVLAGLLIFIIVEKMCSVDKDVDEAAAVTDTAIVARKKTRDAVLPHADHRVVDRDINGSSGNVARVAAKHSKRGRRRRSRAFLSSDLAVNYTAEPQQVRKNLSTSNIMNNNNVGDEDDNDSDDDDVSVAPIKKSSNIHISGYLNLVANSIDNFTHGLAVAGAFLLSTRIGLLTTFAILIHEIPHEVGDFAILMKAGFSRCGAARAQMYTASTGIFGALTALIFSGCSNEMEARTSWIMPFTAGGFLHIALVTVLPELLTESNPKESFKQMCSLMSGITVMHLLTMLNEG